MERVKLVFVGDGLVGKSAFLIRATTQQSPCDDFIDFIPHTVLERYEASMMVKGKPFTVSLWDVAGQEDYDSFRLLTYPETDVIVVCFSVANRYSFENVTAKWIPQARHFDPNIPILLLGTQTDLRIDR